MLMAGKFQNIFKIFFILLTRPNFSPKHQLTCHWDFTFTVHGLHHFGAFTAYVKKKREWRLSCAYTQLFSTLCVLKVSFVFDATSNFFSCIV